MSFFIFNYRYPIFFSKKEERTLCDVQSHARDIQFWISNEIHYWTTLCFQVPSRKHIVFPHYFLLRFVFIFSPSAPAKLLFRYIAHQIEARRRLNCKFCFGLWKSMLASLSFSTLTISRNIKYLLANNDICSIVLVILVRLRAEVNTGNMQMPKSKWILNVKCWINNRSIKIRSKHVTVV